MGFLAMLNDNWSTLPPNAGGADANRCENDELAPWARLRARDATVLIDEVWW
jgi:hypothetical protein